MTEHSPIVYQVLEALRAEDISTEAPDDLWLANEIMWWATRAHVDRAFSERFLAFRELQYLREWKRRVTRMIRGGK